jgi:hypothetical protein
VKNGEKLKLPEILWLPAVNRALARPVVISNQR